ncbi:T9SS type A sorting domain-containing protein [Flavobacterium sp. JAS]|uniref:T9SS type A sorting domain-containing protein n=1 Tax=Flavobacterium sp. JAS TaxID=2897329 RepID=UPI001E392EC9|nr:T9SS type A sorting domain-containing protein [Flavobacterium sp. JAS]MCD0470461.1 T9SS type A sorting domain-containing protein [Flavobacterium sp. JAS]
MKKLYLLLILLFFTMQQLTAQTVETFETLTVSQPNFTSNSKTFNLTSSYISFTVVQFAGLGYNSSNRFIQVADAPGIDAMGQTGTITAATGNFKVNNLWIYVSGDANLNPGATNGGAAGSITFTGKLGGTTQFTIVKTTTGANIGTAAPNKGFMPINFATDGAANYTNINIDQLEIQLSSNYDYFAVDNFTWVDGVSLPTVTTTAAINVGSVKATMGGNVTSTGGDASVQRGIVWATTTNPTIANNKVQNGTGAGAFSGIVTGLTAGTTIYYKAYATNSAGTTYGSEQSLTTGAALSTSSTTQTDILCNGASTGAAGVTATGGVPSYSYSWSPSGGTGATASSLAAGTYTVTITDAESTQITRTFMVTAPPALTGISSTTAVACFGGSTGTATVVPSGGAGSYTYLWSNGATTATASALAAGTYNVTITDANSCTKNIAGITVGQPTSALDGTTSTTPVSCFGGSNGTATVTPSGGTALYTYLWSNGATGATATALAAGTYTVTITDANGCTKTISGIVVGQPTAALDGTASTTPVSCFGGSNGTATVTASGGTPNYSYSWAPTGGTSVIATGLTAGTYSVTITDSKGCPKLVSGIVVGGPVATLSGTTSTTPVTCFGGTNGTATVVASGGTPNYTYSWSPSGGTGATASGLAAGTYSVTITDANGCPKTISNISVGSSTAIIANPTQINVSCNGDSTGSATVAPSGGAGSYTYLWSTGATGATISNLAQGNYSVTIKDANLCPTIQNFTITEPTPLSATTASTDVSCFSGANGTASVTVSGGSPGYSYSWAPSGGSADIATGLSAGNYTCTITDSKGCTLIKPITVGTPATISATEVHTDVSCNGGATGSATVTASGGVGGYTYSWSPSGGTAATATGLTAGNYTVTIQDANTCIHTIGVSIGQPAVLAATVSKTDALCNGGSTGTATVSPTGGTSTYTYLWSPFGGTAAMATGLSVGNYSCLITDAKGCTVTVPVSIGQPSALIASTSQINATCMIGGTAAVTVSGGTGSYSYSWSPSGQTTAIATGLAAGNHSCLITDANGCTLTKPFLIGTTNTLTAATSQTNVLCNGANTGSAWVVPSGAPGPFSYVWAPSGGTSDTASNLTAGNYSVTITSANGCSIVKNFTITEPSALAVTPSQTNLLCNGATTGSASVVVTGGTGSYTYAWSPSGGTAQTATGLSAGTYIVTITDASLCQTTQSFTITEPDAITATVASTNVSCNGGSTGSATVTATGGTGTYTYSWAPSGGTADTATGLSAGIYNVTVTDANSCSTTQSVTITEPTILDATTIQTDVTCIGATDGSATVTTTGGTGAYTYVWSPLGGTAQTATGLSAGNYTVTITDANGCTFAKSVNILTIPDVTAPVPDLANLPVITSSCSILSTQIPVPTATDNCTGIINATTTDPLSYTAVGSYVISWSYDDGHGNISTQNQTVNVTASPLDLVTFSPAEFTYNGSLKSLQVANLPAGATVTYATTPATGTANGATNAGVYTITATVTPSASTPNCSPITLTAQLTIKKAAQLITFGAIPVKILGGSNSFNLNATSDSGLAVTYSFISPTALPAATVVSTTGLVSLLRPGQIVITAHQAGDNNYLPAVDVSQVLIVKNNDVTVTKITIGNKVYLAPAKDIKYLMVCDENNPSVSILNETNATITPSASFTITTPKPGIYTKTVTITSEDGSTTANYTITVEKPFAFFDIVRQKFNNILLVNNNPQTNGGYEFVSYEWFKNGQSVGTGQYYSAGNALGTTLDPTADYSVKMTTKDGKVLHTCNSKISLSKSVEAKLYPNPTQTGRTITVEADFPSEELENMQISLYSVSGQLIKTVKSSTIQTEIQLPQAETSMYIVVVQTANIKKTLKVIVNK